MLSEENSSDISLPNSPTPLSLSMGLTDRIPGELHDRIIDHLHDDRPTLLICSTVCHTWMRASRYHLFSSLEIHRKITSALCSLLRAPHSTIGKYVRDLSVRAGSSLDPNEYLGELLPSVYVLLITASYSVRIQDFLSWTRVYANQLVELVLYSINLISKSCSDFVDGLREFKVLRHVAIVWGPAFPLSEPKGPGTEGQNVAPLPPIRSIILTGYSINLVWWLLAGGARITRLELKFPSFGTLDSSNNPRLCCDVGEYLRAVGTSLQELDLHRQYSKTIDLTTNTNLRALWFHDIRMSLGEWVTFALAQITSPYLHTITLHISSDDFQGQRAQINSFDWRTFGSIIRSAPFHLSLRKLQISWLGYFDVADMSRELIQLLTEYVPSTVKCTIADSFSTARFGATSHTRVFERPDSSQR
ncbi:hypothetical protein H2248_010020 [Termitomyces sp. 'cryptogamus']|nr:hypothetical protein H2248_010020 [Termitomyces sp. 'cryptogamus']